MKYHSKKLVTLLGGALVGVGAFLVAPEGALAVRSADTTGTYEICAETLYLRAWASGPAIDTLKGGSMHADVPRVAGTVLVVFGLMTVMSLYFIFWKRSSDET